MKSIFTTAAVVATTSAFAYPAAASPQYTEGHRYKPFYSRANTDIVKNSGICETTSGVNQYSGYFSVAEDVNLWFWYVLVTFLWLHPLPMSQVLRGPAKRRPSTTRGLLRGRPGGLVGIRSFYATWALPLRQR